MLEIALAQSQRYKGCIHWFKLKLNNGVCKIEKRRPFGWDSYKQLRMALGMSARLRPPDRGRSSAVGRRIGSRHKRNPGRLGYAGVYERTIRQGGLAVVLSAQRQAMARGSRVSRYTLTLWLLLAPVLGDPVVGWFQG